MSLGELREILDRRGLRLRRELGQNFLIHPELADRLASLAGVSARDCVIEVGTGLGVLTRALAARASRVVSIEIDAGLVRALREEGRLPGNVELIHADALALDFAELVEAAAPAPVRVVANLPYASATPLLRRLLGLRARLEDWSVMVQREVGRRLLAPVGTGDYGSLAVLHQLTSEVQRQLDLEPGCFFPAPRVRSSFLRITPLRPGEIAPGELEWVERVVRAAFGQRRKTIQNALRGAGLEAATALAATGIDPRARAETLTPAQHLALARALAEQRAC